VFGVLTAVFVGVSLVFKEIEKRTIYTLLANPVQRWQFVVGKYAGLLMVLIMNVLVMTGMLLLILVVRGETMTGIPVAALMIFVELALVTAFALLFSSFANPILAAVGTAAVYVTGHLTWSFELLKARLPEGLSRSLCDVLYWALPNLGFLNVKSQAVHGGPLPDGYLASALLYGLGYALVVLTVACVVFERRDFN
jgi:ABC-type transport system involved in multi-copper enzyme maturation permease subunit